MNSDFELNANAMLIAPGRLRDAIRHAIGGIQGVFRHPQGERPDRLHMQERCRDCARIANELHDTLFQGFLGASVLLPESVEQTPADSPDKLWLERSIHLVDRAVHDGRIVLQRLATGSPPASLEQALSELRNEFTFCNGVRFRLLIAGKPKALNPGIREQLFLIGREAVVNALRHSGATNIEVEVEYLRNRTRVLVRDDGCGMDPKVVRSGWNSHWGLRGMRERAENIGAQFRIWSKRGAGTEVEICVSGRY